jgi:hypothetical protein
LVVEGNPNIEVASDTIDLFVVELFITAEGREKK